MEISDYKRGCPRVISCKRSGEGTEDRNRIFKKAGTKDRDKIGDIRERTNNFQNKRAKLRRTPRQADIGKIGSAYNAA